MLITFIIFGKFLEAMAKGRTSAALAALTRLSPATALLIRLDGAGHVVTEEEVPTALLQRGDLLKVRPHSSRHGRPLQGQRAGGTRACVGPRLSPDGFCERAGSTIDRQFQHMGLLWRGSSLAAAQLLSQSLMT